MPIAYDINEAAHFCDKSILMGTIQSTLGMQYKNEIVAYIFCN